MRQTGTIKDIWTHLDEGPSAASNAMVCEIHWILAPIIQMVYDLQDTLKDYLSTQQFQSSSFNNTITENHFFICCTSCISVTLKLNLTSDNNYDIMENQNSL